MESEIDTDQYLTFLLDGEEYGVDILRVQEIKGWDEVTPMPNTPDYVLGVMNLRGTVVPIIDLRKRFDLHTVDYGATTVVIVVKVHGEDSQRTMGVVVDAVSEVYNFSAAEMKPAPDFGFAISTDSVKGLATVDEQMVILLDIDHLINRGVMDVMDVMDQTGKE